MNVLGDALGLFLLTVLLFAGWATWRSPFLGVGVLVAGMAFHNFLIMVLVHLGTSHLLIRVVQSWKEAIIALLVVIGGVRLYRSHRAGTLGRPLPLDWVAAAYLAVMALYLLLPSSVLHGHSSFAQRLAAFRIAAYLPLLYGLGRVFAGPLDVELRNVAWLIAGAAAVVGGFGLYELFAVPTRTWVDWGINDFSAWLGFMYSGPGHLPENFFQTLPSGLYLRRLVSTYLSPLGTAYTGLLVFPIAAVLVDRQARRRGTIVAVVALAFLVAGVLFSVTRLAMFALVGEAVLMAIVLRRRWTYVAAGLIALAVVAVITWYPQFGPAVDANLVPGGPDRGSILTNGDPSLAEHLKTIQADLKVAGRHPFGEGLGSAGSSANRYGGSLGNPDYAPGESAILTTFVDTGLIGGLSYLAFFFLGIFWVLRGLWARGTWDMRSALALSAVVGGIALIPITATSDVWGDLSVLFLFWWALGYGISLVTGVVVEGRSGVAPYAPAVSRA